MAEVKDSFLTKIESLYQSRKTEILAAPDAVKVSGTVYYVSADGNDANDGMSPDHPWRTLGKVSETPLDPGDGVLFRRGDVFRGQVKAQPGVTYAAYGKGEKPKFYGWYHDLADPTLWSIYDAEHHIWKLYEPILDCGTLVFNHGQAHCRKLIPSYIGGKFVCRDCEERPFLPAAEMTQDLDMVCLYDARLTDKPSKGECFPIPQLDDDSLGELYLRCDRGNPALVFNSIEALPRRHMFRVGGCNGVTIDNLCLKYIGTHAISAGGSCIESLHVSNCEIGWIGGAIQHYFGTDPNYPQGRRGTVTRFGNGVEIYGGCRDYRVENCYIYQCYDAGITHQVTTRGKTFTMSDIMYCGNLVENCVYSIEYFLEKTMGDTESIMDGCEMRDNFLRLSGYGWGQQRHNVDTPAHIKGWSYENTARNFTIHHNVFDRAAYRMIHTVAKEADSCPEMYGNTYIQYPGNLIGQYGANKIAEPPMLVYDADAETKIQNILGDKDATVHLASPQDQF